MRVELRHLRLVCAIADAGSLTKAAAALGIAGPALTTQLQRIERALGGQLFERDRHGSRPTALGEFVLARARLVLPAMDGLLDEASQLAGAVAGRFRIGAINGPIVGGLVHRLTEVKAQVSTHATWSAGELAESLLAGRLDFALVGTCGDAPAPAGPPLTWLEIADAPVFVLLPEDHPAAGRPEVELGELAEAQWSATPGDGCFFDCFVAACVRAGFTPKCLYETDVGGCIDLALSGQVIALVQPTFRQVPGLVTVPLAGNPLRWRHLLGWHPTSPAAAHAQLVSRLAREAYEEATRRSPSYERWLETLSPR